MDKPLTLDCDNNEAMTNSKYTRSHKKDKHIEKYHLIREFVHRLMSTWSGLHKIT